MHFFVTGHTGFKGSWLVLLLRELGHEVSGYSLAPVEGGIFQNAALEKVLINHFIGDIRDLELLNAALEKSKPDFVIHMAAQPLVLRSYAEPIETYTTNVDGTLNFLIAVEKCASVLAALVITTDKVYRDDEAGPYVEGDALGGHDPYSASKAMADILCQSWAETHPAKKLGVARAGNVIGSGDVSEFRLIPDAIRSIQSSNELEIRHPEAIRPWQHVLDCLFGYLLFLNALTTDETIPKVLNFGPDPSSVRKVGEVIEKIQELNGGLKVNFLQSEVAFKETRVLTLDSTLARSSLGWSNKIAFDAAVEMSLVDSANLTLIVNQIQNFLTKQTLIPKFNSNLQ